MSETLKHWLAPGRRRWLWHPLEAAAAYLAYGIFAILPVERASALGGWLGRKIGLRLAASRKAQRNVARAFPERSEDEHRRIVVGMWDNLGRVMAEYPHLKRIWSRPGYVETVGFERLDAHKDGRAPAVLITAHLANWEVLQTGVFRYGVPLTTIYRKPNNLLIDWLLRRSRPHGERGLVPKGAEGSRALLKTLKDGGCIGLLIDQKLNTGMPAPFFGRDAMTAPAPILFAQRFKCPVIPFRVVRTSGPHFRVEVAAPLDLPQTGDAKADLREGLARMNALIEVWVREHPEQWLWLHRRWPD